MPTSEYDIHLGDKSTMQGYRINSINRDSAPLVAPKFSSGAEGQTDLDLLKSVSVDDLSGGMFQRDWTDSTRAARAVGVFNPMDRSFYPTPYAEPKTTSFSTGYIVAKVDSELTSYIATGRFVTGSGAGTGFVNRLFAVDESDGSLTAITLPSSFTSSSPGFITHMALHEGYLYICSNLARNIFRMKLDTNAFQDIGGKAVLGFELRGVLYVVNENSAVYTVTNEFAAGAATYTKIDVVGLNNRIDAVPSAAVELNSAGWICKPDGIFRFDGVRTVKVLDLVTRSLTVFNGAIYFISGHWIYKFDGVNVTRLQYLDLEEEITDFSFAANGDYLFIQTRIVDYASYTATYDKPVVGTGDAITRLYMYDGQGFSILGERSLDSNFDPPFVGLVRAGNWLLDTLHVALDATSSVEYESTYFLYDLNSFFLPASIATSSKLEVTTSEFDAGFPNIFKTVNAIEVATLNMDADDVITVKYQVFDGLAWSAWLTLGTITASRSYLEVTDSAMLFKRIKFNATVTTLTANSPLKVKSLSMRYTIQPRARWRWTVGLIAHGNNAFLRSGAPETRSANTLSNYITKSIKLKTPSYMFSPDAGKIKTTVNDAAVSFDIDGEVPIYTDPYGELQLVAVKNASSAWEIMRVDTAVYDVGTNKTTITVKERGYLGILPAQLTAGAEFHLAYRIYVTRLMQERTILEEETYDEGAGGNSQVKREFTVELTEA